MATHVWVNPERFHGVERTVTVDGVDLYVQLSPFDAPTGRSWMLRPEEPHLRDPVRIHELGARRGGSHP